MNVVKPLRKLRDSAKINKILASTKAVGHTEVADLQKYSASVAQEELYDHGI